MTRFYTAFALMVSISFALLMFGASAFGRSQHGDIVAYLGSDNRSNEFVVPLLDVSTQMSLRLTSVEAGTTSYLYPSLQGDLFIQMCGWDTCATSILDSDGLISPIISVSEIRFAAWNADGRFAYEMCELTRCNIFLWENGTAHNLTNTPTISERYPTWSNDGRLAFLSCRGECEVTVWNGQTFTHIPADSGIALARPAWSEDNRLAFSAGCSNASGCDMFIWDGIAVQNITPSRHIFGVMPTWGNNGYLSFHSCDSEGICDLMVWDGSQLLNLTNDEVSFAANWRWASRGLAYLSSDGVQLSLRLWDGTMSETIYQQHIGNIPTFKWSDDGWLAFLACPPSALCDLMVWDGVTTYPLLRSLVYGSGSLTWNAQGHLLFSGCFEANADCDVLLWDRQNIIRLTNTPQIDEYFPVWLP